MENELTKLPNIGNVLAKKLVAAGIATKKELESLGAEESFMKIEGDVEPLACFNTLCALEGAIQGVRWHKLSSDRKKELLFFLKSVAKKYVYDI